MQPSPAARQRALFPFVLAIFVSLVLVASGARQALAGVGATLTVVKETDPDGATGFPFAVVGYDSQWGNIGSGNSQFNDPYGVAIDGSGNIYVADTYNNRIQKFDSVGNYVTQWGGNGSGNGQFIQPSRVAVDGSGNVYVSDSGNARIQKFDSLGNYQLQWGTSGSGDGQFDGATGVVVDGSGNVYVADTYNYRIQKFDSLGNYVTKWGSSGSGNGQFNYPFDVAVDGSGNVYVADTFNHRIQKFDSTGNYLTEWGSNGSGSGQFKYPTGLTVDGSGNVYVSDYSNHRIQKFDGTGNYLLQWGSSGAGNGQFNFPRGVAVAASGLVYVADSGNNRIQRFSQSEFTLDDDGSQALANLPAGPQWVREMVPAGWTLTSVDCGAATVSNIDSGVMVTMNGTDPQTCTFNNTGQPLTIAKETDPDGATGFPFAVVGYDSQWGYYGSGNGQFNYPSSVAMDSLGNVYVADSMNDLIQKFDAAGSYVTQWGGNGNGNGQFYSPNGVAVDSLGNVYVADTGNDRIQKFDSAGVYQTQWGGNGSGNSQFISPYGVAVDGSGNVYVADYNNDRIQKFDSAGVYQTQWGGTGSGNGLFFGPYGVAVDSLGNVYVSDSGNNRIQKFDSAGVYQTQWGTTGSGNSQFINPFGVAVDSLGNVYVADSGNNRIQKFDSGGTYLLQWGSNGSANGQLKIPTGVAVAASGFVYVADFENDRIQRFSQSEFTLDDDGSETLMNLSAGPQWVREVLPTGWTLTGVDCGAATVSNIDSGVMITLAAGEAQTCTFSNTGPVASYCPTSDPAVGTLMTDLIGTGQGSKTKGYRTRKLVVPHADDVAALYGQLAATDIGVMKYVRFLPQGYPKIQIKLPTSPAYKAYAISWWGSDLPTDVPWVKGQFFWGQKGNKSPRAFVLWPTYNTAEDYANVFVTFDDSMTNHVAWETGFIPMQTQVIDIPQTQAAGATVVVRVAVVDNDNDGRPVFLAVTVGSQTQSNQDTGPNAKDTLNLYELIFTNVDAGVDEVTVRLESPVPDLIYPDGGDSAAMIGAAVSYACTATP